ncbi:hypothetical protein GCM10010528_01250 [Gordonia defluvii]|uniref:Uncharacterized protein n=1 Tax=Gordonia defluvii TaxID=283718 RepID=A0ABN3Y8P5_9ACTN
MPIDVGYERFRKILVEANWVEANWVEVNWVEVNWVEVSWAETGWVDTGWPDVAQAAHRHCAGRGCSVRRVGACRTDDVEARAGRLDFGADERDCAGVGGATGPAARRTADGTPRPEGSDGDG